MFTRKSQALYLGTILVLLSVGVIIFLACIEVKSDPEFELSCLYRLSDLCFNFR